MIVYRINCHLAKIEDDSLPYIAVLVRMDFLQERSLDSPDNSVRAMGVVILYTDPNDIHIHRRLVQGRLFPFPLQHIRHVSANLYILRFSALPPSLDSDSSAMWRALVSHYLESRCSTT